MVMITCGKFFSTLQNILSLNPIKPLNIGEKEEKGVFKEKGEWTIEGIVNTKNM